jgi:hypothetical protein
MQAVNFVLTTLKVKGANWDQYRNQPNWEDSRKEKDKDALDVCLYETVRPRAKEEIALKQQNQQMSLPMIDKIRITAEWASEHHCGNCEENSAIAFIFLWDLGVRPLDWMKLSKDHLFVVIGRAGDENDWKTWGPVAVICDPWAQGFRRGDIGIGTYPATQFESKMEDLVRGKFTAWSLYREE